MSTLAHLDIDALEKELLDAFDVISCEESLKDVLNNRDSKTELHYFDSALTTASCFWNAFAVGSLQFYRNKSSLDISQIQKV